MTREEAVHAMYMGKKVRHRYFGPDEWMTIEGSMVVTEDGCKHYPFEFWRYRFGPEWDDGYEIVDKN